MKVDIASPLLIKTLSLTHPLLVDEIDRRDMVFIAGTPAHIESTMLVRPVVLVQSLAILDDVPPSRRLALGRTLSAFMQGYIRGRELAPQGTIFQVSPGNSTMEAFARSLGAEAQHPGSQLFRIDNA